MPDCYCSEECDVFTFVQKILNLERERAKGLPLKISTQTGWNELRQRLEDRHSAGLLAYKEAHPETCRDTGPTPEQQQDGDRVASQGEITSLSGRVKHARHAKTKRM